VRPDLGAPASVIPLLYVSVTVLGRMPILSPRVRAHLVHSVQAAGLLSMAVLAMAAAPLARPVEPIVEAGSMPTPAPITAVAEPVGPVTRLITFSEPVKSFPINSKFGLRRLGGEPGARMHRGVDIAAPKGTSIFAAAEGRVIRAGHDPAGFGRFVEIRHPNGLTTLYAHMSRVDVATGDELSAQERVGLVGSTGFSTGPHLHFEVRRNGEALNPSKFIGRSFEVKVDPPAA